MLGRFLLLASAVGKEKPVLPWLPGGKMAMVGAHCGSSTSSISLHSGPCCVEYNPGPLPLSRVKNYVPTGSHCSKPAVIFTTIKNKLVCANPNDKWVKDIMNQLKDNKHSG
ncbi:C-C motif chemokine 5-like isoform X1 [Ammospiza nelsoni]|uniref:C-C motif chemokine 5-like isoform X1 n=1 Tax=Ammospiza nelsoni TaxID=2857394 RepID=UPI00286B3457|nr:C-C motif chemokine 5-like isoform X1 [Ammospiza nelsoni]